MRKDFTVRKTLKVRIREGQLAALSLGFIFGLPQCVGISGTAVTLIEDAPPIAHSCAPI